MSDSLDWVAVDDVIAINKAVVAHSKERHLLASPGGLESAVKRPEQHYNWADDGSYDDLVLLGSKLCIGISQSQAFEQGNKRTGFVAMQMFFRQNSFNIDMAGRNRIADMIFGAAHANHSLRLSDEEFAEHLDEFVVDLRSNLLAGGRIGAMTSSLGLIDSISVALREAGDRVQMAGEAEHPLSQPGMIIGGYTDLVDSGYGIATFSKHGMIQATRLDLENLKREDPDANPDDEPTQLDD